MAESNEEAKEEIGAELIEITDPILLLKPESFIVDTKEIKYIDTVEAWTSFRKSVSIEYLAKYVPISQKKSTSSITKLLNAEEPSTATREHKRYTLFEYTIPDHLKYEYVFTKKRDRECHYCESADERTSKLHGCRICDRVYHEDCVRQRGYCSDALSDQAIKESATHVGWSCPICESLFELLTGEEMEEVMEVFETIAGTDLVIHEYEFLDMQRQSYQQLLGIRMPAYRERVELELFHKMDRTSSGTVGWWEFMPHMAVKLLGKRSPVELLQFLTPRETNTLKYHFAALDPENKAALPRSSSKQAYIDWYTSLIKPKPGVEVNRFWYGGDREEKDEKGSVKVKRSEKQITWQEYLEECALQVIAARPNTVHQKPFIPIMPGKLYKKDEDEDDDENSIHFENDDFQSFCADATAWTEYMKAKIAKNAEEMVRIHGLENLDRSLIAPSCSPSNRSSVSGTF